MKACKGCGKEKSLTEYYKHPKMAGGYLNYCKDCKRNDATRNRAAEIEYYRAYDRKRANLPKRVKARAAYAKTEQGKEAFRRAKAKYREAHPLEVKIRNMVNNAKRDGKLDKKPCEVCGSEKAHAHHKDYSKPFDITWLCPIHHSDWHKHHEPIRLDTGDKNDS